MAISLKMTVQEHVPTCVDLKLLTHPDQLEIHPTEREIERYGGPRGNHTGREHIRCRKRRSNRHLEDALGGDLDAQRVATLVQPQHPDNDDAACGRQRVAVRTQTQPIPSRPR
jgi:hypothetical protein